MSEGNGYGDATQIIKVGKRGMRKFQYDEEPEVLLDIVHVSNQWAIIDEGYRDEKGQVPRARWNEYADAQVKFAEDCLGVKDKMSKAEAMQFIQLMDKEAKKLNDFFEQESGVKQSSRSPSDVTYME